MIQEPQINIIYAVVLVGGGTVGLLASVIMLANEEGYDVSAFEANGQTSVQLQYQLICRSTSWNAFVAKWL